MGMVRTAEPNHFLDSTRPKDGMEGGEAGIEALGGQIERPSDQAPLLAH